MAIDKDDLNNDELDDTVNDDAPVADFLNMSDEDMLASMGSSMALAEPAAAKPGVDAGEVEETEEEKAATAAAAAALDDDEVDPEVADETVEKPADKKADVVDSAAPAKGPADKAAVDKDGKPVPAEADKEKVADAPAVKDEAAVIDYQAEYNKILAPFTANGKQIQPKSVEDAIQLMQMGANYNKKMAGLKPSLKLLKMLEGAQLTNEDDIGFLIDLHKRDPAAINKLIVDSKIDPLDLDAAKAGEYKPGTHKVDDATMDLDAVLEDIKSSPSYSQTLQVVSAEWDQASKNVVIQNPGALKLINQHMDAGIYAIIAAEMENERTFGRLKGLTDIEAYKKVGDAIEARGGFNHLNKGSSPDQAKPAAAAPVIVTPKPAKVDDDKTKAARKAASGTKAAAPGATKLPDDFNVLSMSDADFAKFK